MQTNLEKVIEIVSNLSPEDFKKFIKWYESIREERLNRKEKDLHLKNEQTEKAGAGGVKSGLFD